MQDNQRETLRRLLPNFNAGPDLIVARGKLPEDLRAEVEATESAKLLVAGQRGMGKTTELKRLEGLLSGSDLLPVFVQFGAQEFITHPMLIQAMARGLRERVGARLPGRVANRFEGWFAQEEQVIEVEEGTKGSASVGGKLVIIKADKGVHHKNVKKTTTTVTKAKSIEDLIGLFNEVIKAAGREVRRRVVFIVDDIDKIQNLASIESTFVEASHVISEIGAPCIFTVPITYATSSSLRLATLAYGDIYRVPAIGVVKEDGTPNPSAIGFMKELLQRRMPYNPIPDEILEKVVAASGGVIIDAMRIARLLCKKTLLDDAFRIDGNALDDEFQALVDDYKFVLDTPALWRTLMKMCEREGPKAVMPEENLPMLLYKMIVIEYRDRRVWFDVHPAARRLYEQNADVLAEML